MDDAITTVEMGASSGDETTADTSSTSTGDSTTTDDPSTSSSTGPVKDVGADDWELPPYCGALDVVLVIERTPLTQLEMWDASYEITEGIAARLPGWNVRYLHVVGATSTLPLQCEPTCLDNNTCPIAPELPCAEFTACDWKSGAGMVWRSYETQCLDQPRRWVDADLDDAGELSHCLWSTGAQHGPLSALGPLLDAVSPELISDDGCNAGFVREDAWLLPVFVSHGYPAIEGTPESWAASLAAAKGDDYDAVVPVAILDPQTNPGNPPGCQEGPGDKTNGYHELIAQFPTAILGDLCEPFSPPILEAVDHIAEVCKAGEVPD